MPLLVTAEITGPGIGTVLPGWDGIAGFLLGAIGLVTRNVAPFDLKQVDGRTCVMHLSSGEQKPDRITQCVNNSMNFCAPSTPTYSNMLVVFRIFPLFCTRTLRMCFDGCAVDAQIFVVCVCIQLLKNAQNACFNVTVYPNCGFP